MVSSGEKRSDWDCNASVMLPFFNEGVVLMCFLTN